MKLLVGTLATALLFTMPLAVRSTAGQQAGRGAPPASPKPAVATGEKPATPKADAWPPDEKTLAARRTDAENRRLFQTLDPLVFTLTADFKAVTKDRNPESTKTFPATITYTEASGATTTIPLKIRNRGHARRNPATCDFPPIRLEFQKADVANTVFAGHSELKLGTHCREVIEFEQYVLREYTAYRINNLLTPQSFRARLARVTYVDPATKKSVPQHYGMFIEDDGDVAKRLGGRLQKAPNMMYRHFTPDSATWFGLFEYLIGNTDVSIVAQHNIIAIETPSSGRYIVPYDFDYSGIVAASYAMPNKAFGLGSVKDRLYRGPCRAPEDFEPYLTKLRAAKPDILAIYDGLTDMNEGFRRSVKNYVEDFYKTIDKPSAFKRQILDVCVKSGM